ncbi:hypothetical protein [Paractinoplanes maris]|uniref:hypothetical protein n=1 Tax=Paractinoplanes maris TaxID=1734446 RepID=UPI002021E2B2|nr:hypothetical protein [Actinoplanes maris]
MLAWSCGDLVFAWLSLNGVMTYPAWADAFYLSAYPFLVAAFFLLTRQRGRIRAGSVTDSAIVAVGVVYWAVVIDPILRSVGPVLVRVVTAGYPAAGALLCAVIVPMLLQRGRRSASLWLLTAGSALTLVSNAVCTLLPEVTARTVRSCSRVACWPTSSGARLLCTPRRPIRRRRSATASAGRGCWC